jgi:hypothetical protein
LFGFRSYDPSSGRFLSRDPLWHGGGHSNLYLYVANEPVNFVDSDGLWPVWVVPVVVYFTASAVPFFVTGHDAKPHNYKVDMDLHVNTGTLTVNINDNFYKNYQVSSGNKKAMNDSSYEHVPHSGPIPRGKYSINPGDVVIWPRPWAALARGLGGSDWGHWRVAITKISFENAKLTRDKFFVHTGDTPGSAGCIDVGGGVSGSDDSEEIVNIIRGAKNTIGLSVR